MVLSDSAILKNNFPDESDVMLECAKGYEVENGSNTITCANGVWSKQELTCKSKSTLFHYVSFIMLQFLLVMLA